MLKPTAIIEDCGRTNLKKGVKLAQRFGANPSMPYLHAAKRRGAHTERGREIGHSHFPR